MSEFYAPDTISGKEGKAYANINGRNELLFFVRSLTASVEQLKSEVRALGKRWVGHKVTGLQGSGSMSMYYMSPVFREQMLEYSRTGKALYFDITIENDDPSSRAGRQEVLLKGCSLDSINVAMLDSDSDDVLSEDIDFTFEGYEILKPFSRI